jgi:hypothetical protein
MDLCVRPPQIMGVVAISKEIIESHSVVVGILRHIREFSYSVLGPGGSLFVVSFSPSRQMP